MTPHARAHHYLFAHRALPQLAFADPVGLLDDLQRSDCTERLREFWETVGRSLPVDLRLPGDEVSCHIHREGERVIVLVTLPEPVAETEAFFVAIAFARQRQPDPHASTQASVRYVTLELGMELTTAERYTVLGGWDERGTHFNMGRGPEATPEEFVERVRDLS